MHLGADAPVAIKCLDLPTTLDGALVRPLVESFREASRLHDQLARGNLNIAQSFASGSTLAPATGMIVPYLVREWFEGESLAADLARRRADGQKGRSIDEAVALLEPAVDAVAYAHAQGAPAPRAESEQPVPRRAGRQAHRSRCSTSAWRAP